jgi:ATP-dependent protease ClpP protease subunit
MQLFSILGTFLLLHAASSNFFASASEEILLTTKNSLLIRGQINAATATDFIYEVNKRANKENLYVYLDTNGGSVDAGNKIINEINKYNISCIAERAISMGFVILQSCNKRYVTPMATLMQHQMSYGVVNEKAKVESYVDFIQQIGDHLTEMQSRRIGISAKEFKDRTYNDWWVFGGNAVNENCADDIASVKCNTKLTNQTYNIDYAGNAYIFSYCPLINGPIKVEPLPKSKSGSYYSR